MHTIPHAIDALKKGKMLVVVDDDTREDQADIIFPAIHATEEHIRFLLEHCRGMICAPIDDSIARRLDLPLMVDARSNTEITGVNFTVTIDAKDVKDFGISASDRAHTIRTMVDQTSSAKDFVRPGHIFPLLAAPGGLHERQGHTEATIALCRLAGYDPCGVLCEVLDERGQVRKGSSLMTFAHTHDLPIISIADLRIYLDDHPLPTLAHVSTVLRASEATLPTTYGTWKIISFRSYKDEREHCALVYGEISSSPPLTRIHSECLTGDTFRSLKCDCGEQLKKSMDTIVQEGSGIIIYLNQEGRGIGLSKKIEAYALQEKGLDTVEANIALGYPADIRDYTVASDILHDLGISSITLLTNNPDKISQLSSDGISIIGHRPLEIEANPHNLAYLQTKKKKMGHQLEHLP